MAGFLGGQEVLRGRHKAGLALCMASLPSLTCCHLLTSLLSENQKFIPLSAFVFLQTRSLVPCGQDKASSFGLLRSREYGCFSVISCIVLTADFFFRVCVRMCVGDCLIKNLSGGLFWGSRVILCLLLIASGMQTHQFELS